MATKMKTASVKKNFMYQMIYEVLVIILPFVTSPYIARVIGAEGLGVYSYSHSVAYYFVLFSMLGLKNYGNRAIASNRDKQEDLNKTFSNILAVHIMVSILCCVCYAGYTISLKKDMIYAAIQGLYVVSGLFDISWFYFGIEKFKTTVIRNTIIRILNVICVFVLVKDADDLWKYCLIMAAGMLISQMYLWLPLKKYIKIVRPQKSEMVKHIKPMFILFIPAIAVSLYKYMDKIMIGSISTKTQLGYYENAEKVINVPMTIIGSFGTVMLPKMSNLAASKDKKQSDRYMLLSMRYVMCLSFALAFGLAGVGKIFAPVFWGRKFQISGNIIMGLAITIPFIAFANIIRTQYLIPQGKDKEYLISVICGAVINIVINSLLISDFGAMGATVGTICAEVMVCLIQCFAVRKELPLLTYVKNAYICFLYGLVMFIMVFGIGKVLDVKLTTLVIQIMSGAALYGIATVIYFSVIKEDVFMKMKKKIVKK